MKKDLIAAEKASSGTTLRLLLDSADETQWQTWLPMGLFYGVTTNPILLERANVPCSVERLATLARQGLELGAGEVHLQTWGTGLEALVKTGKDLAAIDDGVVVKVPVTKVGCAAAAQLIAAGIRVTLTGVYACHQVLIAAAVGADYVAPYLGRITDAGGEGREAVAAMQRAMRGIGSPTRVLVASLRSVDDIGLLAAQGLDTFTLSPAIAAQLFDVPLTNAAAISFNRAARRMGAS